METISGDKPMEYKKDFMKIRFESYDDLPLGKILSIRVCIVTAGSDFQEDNNYYPQVSLHEFFYECEYKDEDDSYSIEKVCFSFFSDKILIFKLFYASVT